MVNCFTNLFCSSMPALLVDTDFPFAMAQPRYPCRIAAIFAFMMEEFYVPQHGRRQGNDKGGRSLG